MDVTEPEATTISVPPNQTALAAGINYFYALLPDDAARLAIATTRERFRKAHRANGSPVALQGLHLRLCPMGKPERLRQPLEAALLEAGSAVRAEAFELVLDSAMRFSAREGQFPFVLCADSHSIPLALQLRKLIAAEQARVGLQVTGASSYLPHVVLLEGREIESIEDAIKPISWEVREFVLVRSFFGQSQHEVVGRWPLTREPKPPAYNMLDDLANMGELPDFDDELI